MANAFVNAAGDTTARITDYILAARWSDLPDNVRREALRSFFNILGCTIGGARHDVVALADKSLAEYVGSPHATVIGRGRKADALHASLINCLSSSIYSYDDTHAEAVVHPSGPVATAALALAERRPAKGADFLLAVALGIEFVCRLSKAISVPPAKGTVAWSQTGVAAGIGAAIAAAKLLQLDAVQLQYAIGIALSQAAGFRVMHATMVSSFMPAQAAQTGLRAAIMAEHGFTASPAALEGRYGFLEVFAEQPDTDALAGGLGTRFEILRNTYKPYPCGIVIHPIIDACLQLRQEHSIDAAQVDSVQINASPGAMALCDRRNPQNELQAHVSLYHWTSAVLLRGTARIAELQDPTVQDPAVIAFQDKVTTKRDDSLKGDAAVVAITLKDGSRHTCRIDHCIGSAANPMNDDQLTRKFTELAEPVIGQARTREMVERGWGTESTVDAGDIARAAA
ncbi:MAG TPA: MmgE/PrpD family protein [Acetobacteraceae bacterium]|nr:MmgE/PrpD family protein [Acetobacteraceae bacterium]